MVGPQEELCGPNGYTPRGFTSLPGREAKYGFSGFITTSRRKKKGPTTFVTVRACLAAWSCLYLPRPPCSSLSCNCSTCSIAVSFKHFPQSYFIRGWSTVFHRRKEIEQNLKWAFDKDGRKKDGSVGPVSQPWYLRSCFSCSSDRAPVVLQMLVNGARGS